MYYNFSTLTTPYIFCQIFVLENAFIFQQCSSVSQLVSSSPVKGHKNEQVKNAEHGKGVYHGSLLVEENTEVSDEKHSSTAVLFSEAEDSFTRHCVKDQISNCNGNNEELSQFANSFLAMCCRYFYHLD